MEVKVSKYLPFAFGFVGVWTLLLGLMVIYYIYVANTTMAYMFLIIGGLAILAAINLYFKKSFYSWLFGMAVIVLGGIAVVYQYLTYNKMDWLTLSLFCILGAALVLSSKKYGVQAELHPTAAATTYAVKHMRFFKRIQ